MDTSQVTNMSQMFLNCRSLKELDLSSFQTNHVQDMSQMFGGCSDLRMLNITNFNTSQVTNMNGMFSGCETLEKLDLSNFDTTNVKSMTNMFESTDALKSIKLGDKFVVPKDQEESLKLVNKLWVNIGTGTEDNPKPGDHKSITSAQLLSLGNKGDWVAKPDHEYTGSFEVKIPNNVDDNLTVDVPEAVRPEYVGSSFKIDVPTKEGYTADKSSVAAIAMTDKISTADFVTFTKDVVEKPKVIQPVAQTVAVGADEDVPFSLDNQAEPIPVSLDQPMSQTQPEPASKPVEKVEPKVAPITPVQPKEKGTIAKFMNYVTIHPDLNIAQVYDSYGTVSAGKGLLKNHSWFSDKMMTLAGQKYYHVVDDEWVKADDVYLYEEVKNMVKTRDVMITSVVDSRTHTINNRGLAGLCTMESDKVATLNDHKYYQVSNDEFVDADNVDVVDA